MVESLSTTRRCRLGGQAASRPSPQIDSVTPTASIAVAAPESQIIRFFNRTVDREADRPTHPAQVGRGVSSALSQRVADGTRYHSTKAAAPAQRTKRRSNSALAVLRLAAHSKRARQLGAYLAFVDEGGLLLSPLLRRTLAPKGQTPVLLHKAKDREKVSLIGALTISPGRQRLGLYFGSLIQDNFDNVAVAWFLGHLLRHLRGPVIVVWDNGPMHSGSSIRELQKKYSRLHLERLPPYAPDLNPVEHLWGYLKWSRLCNYAPQDSVELDRVAFQELDAVRLDPKCL